MASTSRFCEVSKDEIECLLESAVPEKTKNVLCKMSLLKQLDYELEISEVIDFYHLIEISSS